MKDKKHSKLGPSKAVRWLSCHASVAMEAGRPNTSSPAAIEGTTAHRLAELHLVYYGQLRISDAPPIAGDTCDETGELYDDEMVAAAAGYIDYLQELCGDAPLSDCAYGAEVKLDGTDIVPHLFGTADALLLVDNKVIVIDFKYGRHPVVARDNYQLLTYAAMARNYISTEYKRAPGKCHAAIFQPRSHGETSSLWKIKRKRLDQHVADIQAASKKIRKAEKQHESGGISNKFFAPSADACQFCLAAGDCAAKADEMKVAIQDAGGVDVTKAEFLPVNDLTPSQVAVVLANQKAIVKWMDAVRDSAKQRLESGEVVQGYKLVSGRSYKSWKDTADTTETLRAFGVDVSDSTMLKSVSQIQKLLDRRGISKEVLSGHVSVKQGSPVMVTQDDKRPAATTVTTSDF